MRLNIVKSQQNNRKFDSWESPHFDAKYQITETGIEFFPLSVSFPIVTLMQKIKTMATEKHHFDNRDESFSMKTFWKNWTAKSLIKESKTIVFQSNSVQQERYFPMRPYLKKLGLWLEKNMRLNVNKSQI